MKDSTLEFLRERNALQDENAALKAERDALKRNIERYDRVLLGMDKEYQVRSDAQSAENAALRKLVADAPHDSKCGAVTERHLPGMIHYETDSADERCPPFHWRYVPCDCWKSKIPEAKP